MPNPEMNNPTPKATPEELENLGKFGEELKGLLDKYNVALTPAMHTVANDKGEIVTVGEIQLKPVRRVVTGE